MKRLSQSGDLHAAGDQSGGLSERIELMVTQWAGLIQAAASKYGLVAAERDEVTQDVRLRLWKALQESGAREITASYAFRAAMSAAVDLVRRDRLSRRAGAESLSTVHVAAASADEAMIASRLNEALGVLSAGVGER